MDSIAAISGAAAPVDPLPRTAQDGPGLSRTGQETGRDLGMESVATLSDGSCIFTPGWYRTAERALQTAQRRVARRKRGSHRRRKAVTLLAKAQQQGKRQRADFHHKTALT
jgi:putative transposase